MLSRALPAASTSLGRRQLDLMGGGGGRICLPGPGGACRGRRRGLATEALAQSALGAVGLAAKGYALVLLAVFFLQRKLMFMTNPNVIDPASQGGNPQIILLDTEGGKERRAAVYFPPDDPKMPVLVYFHGNADQIGNGAAYFGNLFRQRHGLGLFGVEYPGYGLAQPGSTSEASIYEAAEALLRHLVEELGVPSSRIVLFGQSIGCGVAVEMACRGFGSRLVLLAPFTSMSEVSTEIYPFLTPALKVMPFMVLDKFDNKAKAPELRLPTLVVHGSADEIVPFRMGKELAQLIPGAQFLPVQGVGHNDVHERGDILTEIALFAQRDPK